MEGMSCEGQTCPCGAPAVKDVNGTCMCEACAAKMSGGEMPAEGGDMSNDMGGENMESGDNQESAM